MSFYYGSFTLSCIKIEKNIKMIKEFDSNFVQINMRDLVKMSNKRGINIIKLSEKLFVINGILDKQLELINIKGQVMDFLKNDSNEVIRWFYRLIHNVSYDLNNKNKNIFVNYTEIIDESNKTLSNIKEKKINKNILKVIEELPKMKDKEIKDKFIVLYEILEVLIEYVYILKSEKYMQIDKKEEKDKDLKKIEVFKNEYQNFIDLEKKLTYIYLNKKDIIEFHESVTDLIEKLKI